MAMPFTSSQPLNLCAGLPFQPRNTAQLLTEDDTNDVLSFLDRRPLGGVFLRAYINDNGIASPFNRGKFFGVRNTDGGFDAVGLIGHATLFEADDDWAIAALAEVAQETPDLHMVLGPASYVQQFWKHYSTGGKRQRGIASELLFRTCGGQSNQGGVSGLRQATKADIELLLPVHAEMAFNESGVNPLHTNPQAFRDRYARRIDQGRVWVVTDANELLFKADVALESPDTVYLEGVYVAPDARGKGYGRACLSALTRRLLDKVTSVCLLVNEQNAGAHSLYRRSGYSLEEYFQSIFVEQLPAN